MLKGIRKFGSLMKLVDAIALLLVVQTVNSACIWHYHQPEIPEKALDYRKVQKSND